MSETMTSHRKAMEYAEEGFYHKLKGDSARADEFFSLAFELELKAAESYKNSTLEPTRSVLYRSAATLACDCGNLREAERLVATALSGDPPEEIAEELRDLLEDIYFKRHLKIHDVVIDSSTLQLSIAGEAVGFGIARLGDFIPRIQNTEKIINRTFERMCDLPYREGGSGKKAIRENACYMSVPKAASLSVSIKIGRSNAQHDLFLPPPVIIDEVMECFELANGSNIESLKKRINNNAYYRNFIGLSKQIAPDGENINLVGFTVIRNGIEKMVSLKKRTDFITNMDENNLSPNQEQTAVTGKLLYANSIRGDEIKVKEENGKTHKIVVPEGMMSDIVRPLWDCTVIVKGYYCNKVIMLEEIQKVDE
ncbi:MAG: hypothetical protein HQK99_08665 [Nitrospirae bacterium]|nr:hypothetical protein [Nitrospirota bacterium]